jgi:uncharacterized protein (TIGR00730 family)
MPERNGTGAPAAGLLEAMVEEHLDRLGVQRNRDQFRSMLRSVARLAEGDRDRLDLKISSAALAEMVDAFTMFAPYRGTPKVTIFGSARTQPSDPAYAQARALAARMAGAGWMVVTGAGPGIMAASVEGAGKRHSIGVNIRLPFEQGSAPEIADDPKLVEMKYFFTRKLMLMKESKGFVALPGGFGTMDEVFELLTLAQTGKAQLAPIVLLDAPGSGYWQAFERFVSEELATRGLIDDVDRAFYRVTDDIEMAAADILGFYRVFHSCRFVGDRLVIRLRRPVDDELVEQLNEEFADLCTQGRIERSGALAPERAGHDHVSLPRLVLFFDVRRFGRLRQMLDRLNASAASGE